MDGISASLNTNRGSGAALTGMQIAVELGKLAMASSQNTNNAMVEMLQQLEQLSESLAQGLEVHVDFRV